MTDLIADHLGSVIAENGATAASQYRYGPYGEPSSWTGSRFRYTGQIALPEAQLYHYKARVYDPVLGRFLQTDPIGYQDDLNLYAYVGSDPLVRSDPSGLATTADEPDPAEQQRLVVTETSNADGSVSVERFALVTRGVAGEGSIDEAGALNLLPQASADGAPAMLPEGLRDDLLSLSEAADGADVNVLSGTRTEEQNARVGGRPNSAHLERNGGAADITISGRSGQQTASIAFHSQIFNRVTLYRNGSVHVDQRRPAAGVGYYTATSPRDWRPAPPPPAP